MKDFAELQIDKLLSEDFTFNAELYDDDSFKSELMEEDIVPDEEKGVAGEGKEEKKQQREERPGKIDEKGQELLKRLDAMTRMLDEDNERDRLLGEKAREEEMEEMQIEEEMGSDRITVDELSEVDKKVEIKIPEEKKEEEREETYDKNQEEREEDDTGERRKDDNIMEMKKIEVLENREETEKEETVVPEENEESAETNNNADQIGSQELQVSASTIVPSTNEEDDTKEGEERRKEDKIMEMKMIEELKNQEETEKEETVVPEENEGSAEANDNSQELQVSASQASTIVPSTNEEDVEPTEEQVDHGSDASDGSLSDSKEDHDLKEFSPPVSSSPGMFPALSLNQPDGLPSAPLHIEDSSIIKKVIVNVVQPEDPKPRALSASIFAPVPSLTSPLPPNFTRTLKYTHVPARKFKSKTLSPTSAPGTLAPNVTIIPLQFSDSNESEGSFPMTSSWVSQPIPLIPENRLVYRYRREYWSNVKFGR